MSNGYWAVYMPDHPASYEGGWVLEHRFKMEKKLGRFLTAEEIVHHKNDDRADNRLCNLQLLKSKGAHQTLDWRQLSKRKQCLKIKRLSSFALVALKKKTP